MKEGKLKDYCTVIAGQSPSGSSYNENGDGIEFHQGKKAFGEVYIEHSNVWTTEITKKAEAGDILMSVRAPVGPTNLTNREICIGRGLAAIRCSELVVPQYVLYALRNIEHSIIGNDGAVFNSINKKMIEELPLPSFSKEYQCRIVSYLDSAFAQIDELKAKTEQQLSEAKSLFQKALEKAMEPKEGWEEKTLGELTTEMYRGSGIKRDQITKEGIPCVRYGEIYTTYNIAFDKCVSHTKEELLSSPKYFEHGDLLFAITGESVEDIGKTIAYLGYEKCLCGGDIICMKHKQNPKFMGYALSTDSAIRQKGIGKTKLKVVHTNAPALKAIIVPVPPLSEQQHIVEQLDSLSKNVKALEENQRKVTAECDALKQALLREVFE